MKTREYFCTPDGNIAIRIDSQVRNITIDDIDLINDLLIKVEADYPKAYAALESIYGAQAHARWRMFSRFVRCNFGSFDHIDDVDESNFMHFEKVPCPMRGECTHECVICQPEFNTVLTAREFEILTMIVEGLTDQQIADRLFRSYDTIRNHRRNIEHKLQCNSKVKLIEYARKNNII